VFQMLSSLGVVLLCCGSSGGVMRGVGVECHVSIFQSIKKTEICRPGAPGLRHDCFHASTHGLFVNA
jgi:hypothetical protein